MANLNVCSSSLLGISIFFVKLTVSILTHSIYIKQFWKRAVKMARFRFRGTFIDVQRRTKIAFLHYMIFATSKIVSKKGKNILLCLICLIHKGNYIATDTDNSSSSLPFRFKSTFVY